MSVITSRESRQFKELAKLTQKKYRDREGVFIAEGPNVVGEALSSEGIEVLRVFAREGSGYERFAGDVTVLAADLFDRVSDTMTSQGILAVIRKPGHDVIKASSAGSIKASSACGILVLDRLQDPGNIGTIIRTAEGAGISEIVVIKGTCDPYSPKVVRACAGSILRMPIAFCDSAEELIDIAKDAGYRLAVTDVENGVPYYDAGLSGQETPIALVIGNEGNGVSDTFRGAADILVNIPMHGKLESLNASVAAALLMYEMSRPE